MIIDRIREARERQIELVESMSHARLNEPLTPVFGGSGRHGGTLRSAGWVATKTFQHTWEHGNAVLRVALFAPR